MHKLSLVAGLAVAALIPTLASAQSSCEQQRGGRVVATVAGAGIGAVLGSAIAGRGDHSTGAVVGGLGGALIGNQLAKPNADCAHAYGYYDQNGQWHANTVARTDAQGYYDRDGNWVDGAPNGYYQDGRWVPAQTSRDYAGYTDAYGRWIPASANGYYNDRGEWVTTAPGYYDTRGQWVAGQTSGAYDRQGRWISGARSGHTDANGVWVADAQPGYYDSNHRWRSGTVNGYYDARGSWVTVASADDRRRTGSVTYNYDRDLAQAPRDIRAREDWLEQRIRAAQSDGTLGRMETQRDLRDLQSIRRSEAKMRTYDGRLSDRNEVYLQARLDRLSANLRSSMNDGRRGY